jgi:2-oxoacid:acceptor oxidoreductase gamma subunit (pyruvate/2-ketoisovalerate family)
MQWACSHAESTALTKIFTNLDSCTSFFCFRSRGAVHNCTFLLYHLIGGEISCKIAIGKVFRKKPLLRETCISKEKRSNLLQQGETENMSHLQEIRWHGRGGQGAWTASELLARAAIYEGKYVQSFPAFGAERMGAPLAAYTRISDQPINLHCAIYTPNVVVVLDPTLLNAIKVNEGLPDDGILIVNTRESPAELRKRLNLEKHQVWTVPATDLAIKTLSAPITNTVMLGATTRATKLVTLENIEKAIRERFKERPDMAEKNIAVIKEAYTEAKQG